MSESTKSFNQLGLSEHLLATLSELNFTAPTSVQEQAIPLVLEGKDVLAGAQTGTGKTAAFGLPIIQRLIETKDNVIPNPKLVRPTGRDKNEYDAQDAHGAGQENVGDGNPEEHLLLVP